MADEMSVCKQLYQLFRINFEIEFAQMAMILKSMLNKNSIGSFSKALAMVVNWL
jgi:hypothetical protein